MLAHSQDNRNGLGWTRRNPEVRGFIQKQPGHEPRVHTDAGVVDSGLTVPSHNASPEAVALWSSSLTLAWKIIKYMSPCHVGNPGEAPSLWLWPGSALVATATGWRQPVQIPILLAPFCHFNFQISQSILNKNSRVAEIMETREPGLGLHQP